MTTSQTAAPRFRTLDLAYVALFAVLMAVCAWITIPLPKPLVQFTMQTFAMFMALTALGGRRGLYAMLVYLLLGAVGIPAFSGFRGGIGVLLDTTGGYIIGFVAAALLYWLVTAKCGDSMPVVIAACVLGLAVCYAFGTAWFLVVYARNVGPIGLATALGWCVFPYISPDLAKLALAVAVSRRVKKFLTGRSPRPVGRGLLYPFFRLDSACSFKRASTRFKPFQQRQPTAARMANPPTRLSFFC